MVIFKCLKDKLEGFKSSHEWELCEKNHFHIILIYRIYRKKPLSELLSFSDFFDSLSMHKKITIPHKATSSDWNASLMVLLKNSTLFSININPYTPSAITLKNEWINEQVLLQVQNNSTSHHGTNLYALSSHWGDLSVQWD